jgi:hypothetical protein
VRSSWASVRVRDLLSKAADFFEKTATEPEPEATSAPAQIEPSNIVPFDIETFEDAVFEEVAVKTRR